MTQTFLNNVLLYIAYIAFAIALILLFIFVIIRIKYYFEHRISRKIIHDKIEAENYLLRQRFKAFININNIDYELDKLGFKKLEDNEHHVRYEKNVEDCDFVHVVMLLHRNSGRHILQSYDRDLFDEKKIGNTNVGLTYKELILFALKMKEKGWG